MKVQIELDWGRQWNGRHYEETKGTGVTAQCMEYHGNSFKGCPLGRGTGTTDSVAISCSISDFIRRGRDEYIGKEALVVEIEKIVDHRKQ